MYHHLTHYDDLDRLKAELEQEKRYRFGSVETIEWSNAELERSISELETYLQELEESNGRTVDDNEWKVRFESQTALNKQLQEQKDWLEAELVEARRKLTTGSYPEAMNFNLDALNESELLRLVKHLEKMRNDVFSNLRDTEWKLDKEAKEFHHFDEMRRVYRVDLKHANHAIERMRLSNVLDPSGLVSPIYPPGYFRWLDTHTPLPLPIPLNIKGTGESDIDGVKTNQNKKSDGGGGGKSKGKLDSNQNPPRSKSRTEKKYKKKEIPIEEPETQNVNGNCETDNGNATDVSGGGDQDVTGKQSNMSSGADSFTKEEPIPKRESSKDRSPNEY